MSADRTFFRYSRADSILAISGVAHVAFLLWTFYAFASLPWWALVLSFLTCSVLICWNLQVVSHNFIHNPFFSNRWLNRCFGVLESLAIGMPHQLYHHYHMNHHWGDNDAKGPDGSTRDWSSIYRYSRDNNPEPFWRYCLFSFFRVEVTPVLRVAIKHGKVNVAQVVVETLALGGFWLLMGLVDWRYFCFFYLPSFFFGWVISYAEGYLEHFGAEPGNPYANSVSSYNWLYNVLWFNNGYHQEHHWDPKMHWTRMRQLHEQIEQHLAEHNTPVLRGPHLTGMIEDYFFGRRSLTAPRAAAVVQQIRPPRAA